MRLIETIGAAFLCLIIAAPVYAQQEQHDQQEDKDQPKQEEKKAQPEKSAKQNEKSAPEEKNARPEEKNARQENNGKPEGKPEERNAQPARQAQGNGGRIPDARYKANFGREHSFRVSEGDYRNHRFQYGGYWFGFVDPWPSNWLYTQNVYVMEINGAYFLCNPTYPGVNLAINVTL